MSDVLTDKIDVTVRGKNYSFRIPGVRYDIEVGYRAAAIRRASAPEGGGAVGTVDWQAVQASRSFAVIELYLISADEQWPFSAGTDGKPVVDSGKFPVKKMTTAYEIGEAFETEFNRFRDDRPADDKPAGTEAMVGQQDPGAQ